MDHHSLDSLSLLQRISAGQEDLKYTVFLLFHFMAGGIPTVKVTGEVHLLRRRRPLPVIPAVIRLMEAVEQMGIGKVRKRIAVFEKLFFLLFKTLQPQVELFLERSKILIVLYDLMLHSHTSAFYSNITLPWFDFFVKEQSFTKKRLSF